jgi:hypothetical protein
VKYCQRRITFMVSLKRILKMAQLEPVGSSRGMFAGSLSTVVGALAIEEDVLEDMGGRADDDALGEGLREEVGVKPEIGTKELEGLFVAVVGRAGPIT